MISKIKYLFEFSDLTIERIAEEVGLTFKDASGASRSDAVLGACPHGCKEAGDCISPVEWCPHTPDGCYPEEWGPSDNRRLTCSCGNPDPEHMDKVPNAELRGATDE